MLRHISYAAILGFADGIYTVTIGELTMLVVCTRGGTGDWKQRYLLRVPVTGTVDGYSAENYVSPVQFNEKTHEYVLYHPEAWYDDAGVPRYEADVAITKVAAENGRTYSKKCIGCHTNGLREIGQDNNGEWLYRPYPAGLFRSDDPTWTPTLETGMLISTGKTPKFSCISSDPAASGGIIPLKATSAENKP